MEREELEEIIGSGAMREYDDTEEYDRPKIHEWARKLRGFSDKELREQVSMYVLDAAIANSRRKWWDASWCLSSACMHEAARRHLAAGHDKDCQGDNIYKLGWNDAYRSQGYTPGPFRPCTCGVDQR